jgi:predicted TIM-barrel fold metal-dependent hydrolase
MSRIALFDSLCHPTLTGGWFGRDCDASFETLARDLREAGFARACAVGLAGHEDYDHETFAARCRTFSALVPIAGVAPKPGPEIDRELDMVRDLNFRGIKLHPRISGFGYNDPCLAATFKAATRRSLPVFLCTYYHADAARYPSTDPLFAVARAVKSAPETRLVLLHGGAVELMRWMQFARHIPTILFDISFTLMRYRGSSLDADIAWLFDGFQDRTCIGTDHPEYRCADVRTRFEELAARATPDAARKVGGLNLARFLGVDFP